MKFEPWTCEPIGPDVGYMLRASIDNGRSVYTSSNFYWPSHGYVEPEENYSIFDLFHNNPRGLYGILDGVGDWNMIPSGANCITQVVAVLRSECKKDPMGDAVYAPRGWVVYSGDALTALKTYLPLVLSAGASKEKIDDAIDIGCFIGSRTSVERNDDVAAVGDDLANVSTSGINRFAIATRGGLAIAKGSKGTAIVGGPGFAHAPGQLGRAISAGPLTREYFSSQIKNGASAGEFGIAACFMPDGMVKAGLGGAVFITEWGIGIDGFKIKHVFCSKAGENGIKPDTWYKLKDGKPVEVQS